MVDNKNIADKAVEATDESEGAADDNYSTQEYLEKKLVEDQLKEQNRQISDNPILQKIARILTNSKPEDWRTAGRELNIETRIPTPTPVYEYAYIRDIKDKSLILKSSTAVTCHYSPGGYCPMPVSSPQYSIEIRDIVFDADKLVNPKYANNFKGKFLEIVATGDVAQKLFLIIHNLIKGSSKSLYKEFDDAASALYESLAERVRLRGLTDWTCSVEMKDAKEITTYVCPHEKFEIKVLKVIEGWDVNFQVKILQNKMEFSRQGPTPKIVYQEIQDLEQENQIIKLEGKLKDLGLDDSEDVF